MYNFSKFTCSLNEPEEGVCPTDSRLRPDQRIMEGQDFDKANEEKVHQQTVSYGLKSKLVSDGGEYEHLLVQVYLDHLLLITPNTHHVFLAIIDSFGGETKSQAEEERGSCRRGCRSCCNGQP